MAAAVVARIALLLPPLGWMLVFYLAALAVLFVSAFWSIDSFTGKLTHAWTWSNFHTILHDKTTARSRGERSGWQPP